MKMRMPVAGIILFGFLLSCTEDDPIENEYTLSSIDLTIGSENRYIFTVTEDSSGIPKETHRDTFGVRVESVGQTLAGYTDLIKVKAYKLSCDTMYANAWYRQTLEYFIDIAYQFAGTVPVVIPKRGAESPVVLANDFSVQSKLQRLTMRFQSYQDTIVRTDLRYVLKYPLSAGKTWKSFSDPFLQTREVNGNVTVTLPSGVFTCAKIFTAIPVFAPTLEWFDYISREGLILRTITDSLVITTAQNPDGNGMKRKITQRFELLGRTP